MEKGDDSVRYKFGSILPVSAGLFWFGLLAAGLSSVWNDNSTPGKAAKTSPSWPAKNHIPRTNKRPTLVRLARSHCSYTRNSLRELDRRLAQCRAAARVFALFYQPDGLPKDCPKDWTKTDLWQTAVARSGATLLPAVPGREAKNFHALPAEPVVRNDATSQLLFEVGITGSRGHANAPSGKHAMLKLLTSDTTARTRTQVYGCARFDARCASQPEGI